MINSKLLTWSNRVFLIICAIITLLYAVSTGGHTALRNLIDIYAAIQFVLLSGVLIFMIYTAKKQRLYGWLYCLSAILTLIQIIPAALFYGGYGWNLYYSLFIVFHLAMLVWGAVNLIALIKARHR